MNCNCEYSANSLQFYLEQWLFMVELSVMKLNSCKQMQRQYPHSYDVSVQVIVARRMCWVLTLCKPCEVHLPLTPYQQRLVRYGVQAVLAALG